MHAGDFLLVIWYFLLALVTFGSRRAADAKRRGAIKSIALHRAVKAIPKRNVEGVSASRPMRIMDGASDVPFRSLGAAMGLGRGRVDVLAMPTGSHGGTAKERAVENRGTCSLVIPAWLRCLSSLPAKVAKVKMKGAIFLCLLLACIVSC